MDHFIHMLAKESSVAVRQELGGTRPTLPALLCSTAATATAALLQALPPPCHQLVLARPAGPVRTAGGHPESAGHCRPPMYFLPSWADLPLNPAASGLPGYHSEFLAHAVFAAAPASTEEDELPSPPPP